MQIDPLGRIARGIARNPNAPKDLLEKLANDPLYYIRRDVALNPNTPKHVLTYLRNDSNKIVSIYASERTDIPDDFFEEITTTHPYTEATHPNTPSNFLEKLADKYPYEVAAHPNTTAHVLRALPDNYLDVVASNPNTPIDLLEQLITHPDFLVRKFLAKNPKMSGELLKRLYESKTKNVLCNYIKEDEETLLNELATNPNTPGEVLKEIVEKIEKINFEEVKITESEKNSQTSDWQKIIFDEESKDHFISKLNLAIDNITERKDFIQANAINIALDYLEMILTTTKINRLEKAMNNKKQNEFIKLAIILNPITPKEFLEKLTTDEEEIIRMAATKVLNLPKEQKESTPKRRTKKKPQ